LRLSQQTNQKARTLNIRQRLFSVDVFRGITIALMILVNNPGGDLYYSILQHADWNGWTLADLVFPFFLFILGAVIPYSLKKRVERGDSRGKIALHIMRRSVILFALGLLINGFPLYNLSTLRIMGVLQRIALCYLFASIVSLAFDVKKQFIVAVLLPVIYWALMMLVPVPGYGAGVLEKGKNLAAYVDYAVFGQGHLWGPLGTWDPEGLLSTIPAIGTTLIGVLAGWFLKSDHRERAKLVDLLLLGGLLVLVGTVWGFSFPINKSIWTSSYVALTGGIALIFLGCGYYLIDVRKHKSWTKVFLVLGMNAIAVYVFSEIVNNALLSIYVPLVNNTSTSAKNLIYQNLFVPLAGPLNGSLLYALACLMLWVVVAVILYRKRIFIKIA
jgi:predicted acyltransferase